MSGSSTSVFFKNLKPGRTINLLLRNGLQSNNRRREDSLTL
jgi:hypothetical protein